MDELWYAGDRVKLTGSQWAYGGAGYSIGDTLTLKTAINPDEWECEEEFDGAHLYVQTSPSGAWGAVKIEDGPNVPKPEGLDARPLFNEYKPTTGEVRTTSSTGGEKGVKPEAYALIPWEAMDEVARVYEFGQRKYAAHNWRKGYEWNKSFSALCRHVFAFWRGEDRDPESNLSHLAHAAFHILGLLTFWLDRERYGEFDDRYVSPTPDSDGDK